MKNQGHLIAWSRVSWLLKRKPAELRTFLIGIVKPPPDRSEDDHSRIPKEQQAAAAKAAFGKSFEELDAQWKKFVARS
jgi:Xaa-Pro aminopeptidase